MPEDTQITKVTRRGFLDRLLQGAVVLGIGVFVYPVVKYVIPPGDTEGKESEVDAGPVADLKIGTAKKVEYNGKPVLLINTKVGFSAISAVCSHLGCIVDWNEDKQVVTCPCHNAVFDYNGNIVSGPPPLPLEKLDVNVRGDKIMIRKKG